MTSTILRGATTNFNSRPSARGDAAEEARDAWNAISIHSPPRGATSVFWHCALITYYFNSRPSARGDVELSAITGLPYISIHAPPRGATEDAGVPCDGGNFNSRPSARGDAGGSGWPPAGSAISIHAPPRGATPPAQPQIRTACVFQFTPLREGRQVYKSHGFGRTYFNSRPSARGDSPGRGYQLLINISIHAPPRGATAGCITVVAVSSNFNSRPSARGDRHSSNFA